MVTLYSFHGFPSGRENRSLQHLDLERATERPGAIVGLRAVVTHEDAAVTTITIECAAEFPDIRRCLHPARRLQIELAEFLQLLIFCFRQELDAHGLSHIHGGGFWSVFLS